MSVLFEAGKVLSTPRGSLVYHLLLLLTVEAKLGVAWEKWRRPRRGQARRLLVAVGGPVLVWLIYVGAGLMAAAGWIDRASLLPPGAFSRHMLAG